MKFIREVFTVLAIISSSFVLCDSSKSNNNGDVVVVGAAGGGSPTPTTNLRQRRRVEEEDHQSRRNLGGNRVNCSHDLVDTSAYYRICKWNDSTKCIKMVTTEKTKLKTYDSSDDSFLWQFEEVHPSTLDKDRVKLTNKEYDHVLTAGDIDGNDNTPYFKISQSSDPCNLNDSIKVSYLDSTGIPSNDWLNVSNDNINWVSSSGSGEKFKIILAN